MESIFKHYEEYNQVNEFFNFFSKVRIRKTSAGGKGVFAKSNIDGSTRIGIAAKNDKLTKLARFMKHSTEPNVLLIRKGNKTMLITNDNIKIGEELTIDHDELNSLFDKPKSKKEEPEEETESTESETDK